MKLKFQTQCCADYTTWKDDLITVSDGNHSVLFSQKDGFRLNAMDEVLFNSHSHSASLEFCKVSQLVVRLAVAGVIIIVFLSTSVSMSSQASASPMRLSSNLSPSPTTIRSEISSFIYVNI